MQDITLTTEVTIPIARPMVVTSIYASNLAAERDDLWAELISIQQLVSLHLEPWLVAGDFNHVTTPLEHSSPTVQAISSDMIEFRDTILHLDLFDLRYHGVFNTWSNKQPASPIAKKLDRALVNHHWISSLPNSSAIFLAPEFSDHSPCLINLETPCLLPAQNPLNSSITSPNIVFSFLLWVTPASLPETFQQLSRNCAGK